MKVTGYKLREAIRRAVQRYDLAQRVFQDSQMGFSDETKDPIAAAAAYNAAGIAVAQLQSLQQRYNDQVIITIDSADVPAKMTLATAVKLVGHCGALEKQWRTVAVGKKERHSFVDPGLERDNSKTYAKRMVTVQQAAEFADKAGNTAARLRAAIAISNNEERDIDGVPEGLL